MTIKIINEVGSINEVDESEETFVCEHCGRKAETDACTLSEFGLCENCFDEWQRGDLILDEMDDL